MRLRLTTGDSGYRPHMSEANTYPAFESPNGADDRVDQLSDAGESSPRTRPVAAQDPDVEPIIDHGDTPTQDERIAQRPDF